MSILSNNVILGDGVVRTYVEDVFSTYLYTGNGSTQTITNGIDLAGKGGLVWTKERSGPNSHLLYDTNRGTGKYLSSDTTTAETTNATTLTSFNSNGFSLGVNASYNGNGTTYASWTFRKAPKFFDVVTWTGDGTSSRNIAHALGSTPGFIIVKRTNSTSSWWCWHRSISTGDLSGNDLIVLNSTAAKTNLGTVIGTASSTTFQVGGDSSVNASGSTYVAYIFAHDAGGFGDTGNDSVIKCGSFTPNGSYQATVDLGWEPQWVMIKSSTTASGWYIIDNMRGWSNGSSDAKLLANSSDAESSAAYGHPLATGFYADGFDTSIYIAIRRGPMKTPTDATKVFSPLTLNGTTGTKLTTGFPVDMQISAVRTVTDSSANNVVHDRTRGVSTNTTAVYKKLNTATTEQEGTVGTDSLFWDNTGFQFPAYISGYSSIFYNFRRAPGFFDVVAYTGTGAARTVSHNLGVVPELIIIKDRFATYNWAIYNSTLGVNGLLLFTTNANLGSGVWGSTAPTNTVFSVDPTNSTVNGSGDNYIAYLFASCPGVSKVFNYTGTGTTKQIDCGFTSGARLVLIKRTDSTGDWYIWDSARGIISGNDPYLLLNSAAAEVTNTDYIDPYSAGFEISSTAPAAINANGGSYIGLAVA